MNYYDLTIVLDGKNTPAKKKAAMEKLEKLVSIYNGKVHEILDMGERELAYPINKSKTGFIMTYPLEMNPDDAQKLNGKLRLEDYIIRYLLVKVDKLREKKAKSKTERVTLVPEEGTTQE